MEGKENIIFKRYIIFVLNTLFNIRTGLWSVVMRTYYIY